MASTYSQRLRIELIGAGDQVGTWGATTNSNFGTIVDSAIAGYTAVSVTTANQALTALNGAADQSRMAIVSLTTTTTANFNVYAPPASKLYVIKNASAYTATLYNSTVLGNTTAAGTGVAIPAGKTMTVWSDGTNFATQNNHIIGTVVGDVTGNASTVTNGVYTSGAQTIAGVKSFTSQIDAQAGVLGDLTGNVTGNADTATSAASVTGTSTSAVVTSALGSGTASSSTFLRGDRSWAAVPDPIPSGTKMLFVQTTAPTGWTKDTTHNDKALRVVSGTAATGGSVSFSAAFTSQTASGTVGDTTLTTAQIPAHTHPLRSGDSYSGSSTSNVQGVPTGSGYFGYVTGSTGGGGSHTHTFSGTAINLAVQYVDVIIATKN